MIDWKGSRKRKIIRVLAAALAFYLLFTYPNIQEILSVLASGTPGEEDAASVTTSAELSEEAEEAQESDEQSVTVKTSEQTVPVEMEEPTVIAEAAAKQPTPTEKTEQTTTTKTTEQTDSKETTDQTSPTETTSSNLPETDSADPAVQSLLDSIAALPDHEEYFANEPSAEAEEAYSQWMEGLHRYAGEAINMQETYGELTEEQLLQIPSEAQDKLAAWTQTAMQIAENSISTMLSAGGSYGGVSWHFDGDTLTISKIDSGSGAMRDFEYGSGVNASKNAPWYENYRNDITSVVIKDGVTNIGNFAFYMCTSITSVTVPSSVTSIGEGAFDYCNNLTDITFTNPTPPTIHADCFLDCGFVKNNSQGIHAPCGWDGKLNETNGWAQYASNVDQAPHTEEIVPGTAATCTSTGLTDGKKCSVCGKILEAQETIPAKGHNYKHSASYHNLYQKCDNGCNHSATATLSLSETTFVYDGTVHEPAVISYYGSTWVGTKPNIVYYGDKTNVGTVTVRMNVSTVGTASLEYTITKATPSYSTPTGLTAAYGQTLANVQLPTDANGTWSWNSPSTSVGDLGTHSFMATYTPKDTANYNTVSDIQVSIDVGKANPSYTVPTNLTATYGQTLANVSLPSGFSWQDAASTSVGTVGTNRFKVKYTPTDTANYNTVSNIQVSIVVGKATPSYTVPTGLTATYGQTLANVTLPSGFSWQDAVSTSVGTVGTNSFNVKYTPTDTANYNTVSNIQVSIVVGKANPTVTAPTGLTATYGQTLGNVRLPSGWEWVKSSTTSVGNVGTNTFTAAYTPDDTSNYNTWSANLKITVSAKSISFTSIDSIASQIYTGSAFTPDVTVKDGKTTLIKNSDYTVSYSANTDAGTATVKITGQGNYNGSKTANFTITPKSLTGSMVTISFTSTPYTGSAIKPKVTVKDGTALTDADYSVTYSNNTNKGTAKVTVKGTHNYQGTIEKTFTITAADISSATVTLTAGTLTYNGSLQTKGVDSVVVGGRTLISGTDYTISGNTRTGAGTYSITITGTGNYTNTKVVTYKIEPKSLTNSMITVASGPHYYTGGEIKPAVTVKDGEKTLAENTDYTVAYSNNTESGINSAIVKITGHGNYTGTPTKNFTIEYQPLPTGKSLADYITVSPTPNEDGWYGFDITVEPKDGYDVGDTDAATGNVTVTGETVTDGAVKAIYIKDGSKVYKAQFSYKLDKSIPAVNLANMTVQNGSKPNNDLITGKSNMVIKIPKSCITDSKSGIAEVSYIAAPDSGTPKSGTVDLSGGNYEIALGEEFVGTIELTVKDKVGHITQVTLPTATGKVIVEENLPVVKFTPPETPKLNDNGWYNANFDISVAVTDDKNSDGTATIPSGGIAKIEWKDGESGIPHSITVQPEDSLSYGQTFTISTSNGEHIYCVNVVDNAGNESGWQKYSVKIDIAAPSFNENLTAENPTKEGADITFTPSEKVTVYWIVSDEGTAPTAEEVIAKSSQSEQIGGKLDVSDGSAGSFTVSGLTAGQKHTVYAVLEDVTGNLSSINSVSFLTLQEKPEATFEQIDVDYSGENITLPTDMGELEVYTDPSDPSGSKIEPNDDGTITVEPGTKIYIRHPEKTTEDGLTTPASAPIEIDIPPKLSTPSEKQVTITETTLTVTNPTPGEEYVIAEKGQAPDWSQANTTGEFTGLTPNKEYELYVRKKATDSNFASDPVKTETHTHVIINEPITEGEGTGVDGNTATKPILPNEDGTVTFTGTYNEEYTPVIKIGDKEIIPGTEDTNSEITWNEGTKGTWEYTLEVPDNETDAEITVEFRKRTFTGIKVTPNALTIYADDPANESMDALKAYVEENSSVKALYDNNTSEAVEASYTTGGSFAQKEAVYTYSVSKNAKTDSITLTVKPVTASVTAPDKYLQSIKAEEGYTADEVITWLPTQVTVTYTGEDYTAKTENRTVTWNTNSVDADFGKTIGEKPVTGTVDLPSWAAGESSVSMMIEFVDKNVLKGDQLKIDLPNFSYGAHSSPNPTGSITETDTNPEYTYLYSADGGITWVTEDQLPKSDSGNIVPGEYIVKVSYIGDDCIGEKTASFTVEKNKLTILPGTLEVLSKNYDGTLNAEIKPGGQPALSGVVEGDNVTLGGTLKAVFTEYGPKANIPVTVTGFILEGENARFYEFKEAALTLYAAINNEDGTPPSSDKEDSDHDVNDDSTTSEDDGDSNTSNTSNTSNSSNTSNTSNSSNTSNISNTSNATTAASTLGLTTQATPKLTDSTESSLPTDAQKNPPEDNAEAAISAITETKEIAEITELSEATEQSEQDKEPNNTVTPNPESAEPAQPQEEAAQTVQAFVENGKLVISEGTASTGNAAGTSTTTTTATTATATTATTTLKVGAGSVAVKVVCEDKKYTVGVKDTVALVNAVLKSEQIQLANEGENIEIRVDVKDISKAVPEQDKAVIDSGLAEYRAEMPDMALGKYVDISIFAKVGENKWSVVTSTEEPIEVVIGIPEELQKEGRVFYIIRSHDGQHILLEDIDNNPKTVTVLSSLFSAYAIAYRDTEESAKCSLCHICPTFFGICCFIWLAIPLVIIPIILIVIRKKRKTQNEEEKKRTAITA